MRAGTGIPSCSISLGYILMGVKAGEGVDLVDEDAAGVLLYEEVAAGQTLAAQCGVGHGGVGLHLVQLFFGQLWPG